MLATDNHVFNGMSVGDVTLIRISKATLLYSFELWINLSL